MMNMHCNKIQSRFSSGNTPSPPQFGFGLVTVKRPGKQFFSHVDRITVSFVFNSTLESFKCLACRNLYPM